MTLAFWTHFWFYWLATVAVTFAVPELTTLAILHATGAKHIATWTLSDTIRRWSAEHAWLKYLVTATALFLLWHFFIQQNPT